MANVEGRMGKRESREMEIEQKKKMTRTSTQACTLPEALVLSRRQFIGNISPRAQRPQN